MYGKFNYFNETLTWNPDRRLSYYCQDDTIDIIPLAFLPIFHDKGGYPAVNFANVSYLSPRHMVLMTCLSEMIRLAVAAMHSQAQILQIVRSYPRTSRNVRQRVKL